MKYDFVVIGAGVSGITSALLLAQHGYQVALVEKRERTAPLLRGFSRRGVHFDTGFHYSGGLGKGEPLDLFFRYLGLSDRLTTFPFRADGFDLFRSLDGFECSLPYGYEPLRERLCQTFPKEASAIEQYLRLVETTCATLPYLNLAADFGSAMSLQGVHGPTLSETLDRLTQNRRLKGVLGMHCLLYGVAPEEIPFSQHARIVGNYYRSVHGIRGGGFSLAQAFEQRLNTLGVDIRCGSSVVELKLGPEGSLAGVRLANGEELICSGCIATIDPRCLPGLVPTGLFRPSFTKRLALLEESMSAYVVYGAATSPVPSLAGRNLFLLPDAASLAGLGKRPLEESPLYLTAAYPDAGGSPAGFIGISPARFADTAQWQGSTSGDRPAGYRRFKEDLTARMARQIARFCPELAKDAAYLEPSTPLTFRDFTSMPHGGLYGVKHMVGQYNPLPVTRLAGLFLAGQGVVAPGILGAVLSGFVAVGSILGHDRLREEVRACS